MLRLADFTVHKKKCCGDLFSSLSPKKSMHSPHFIRDSKETHLLNRYGYNKPGEGQFGLDKWVMIIIASGLLVRNYNL